MSDKIPKFERPELVFGFVAPIGANVGQTVNQFKRSLESLGYTVEDVKVTDAFKHFREVVKPVAPLEHKRTKERYETHIAYGNQLRSHFGDDSLLAMTSIVRLHRKRLRTRKDPPQPFQGIAYLVHQFKRKEEVELFRAVYGSIFFQVSVYSRRGARVDYLARSFSEGANGKTTTPFLADAETIINIDENDTDTHGQQVGQIFHDADFILNLDIAVPSLERQVSRFCELIFGANNHSPTRSEYGMFLAKAAAFRTLDLSRQVGAAIFSPVGEVVALGSNEVPKAHGGTYWSDGKEDDRDYVREVDSNDQRKRQILRELLEIANPERAESLLSDPNIKNSQFMDALEYGRIVHAEMSAISDAARLGRSIKDTTLFTTTFPCHMCAKHIVAAGIARVVFLEPYPKSLAARLHSDSISVEENDRGRYRHYPAVEFEHFYGITTRRYRELFSRGKRKDTEGKFVPFGRYGTPLPILDVRDPFYVPLEKRVVEQVEKLSLKALQSLNAEDHS
jgi:deoxycytidylate deaminase